MNTTVKNTAKVVLGFIEVAFEIARYLDDHIRIAPFEREQRGRIIRRLFWKDACFLC